MKGKTTYCVDPKAGYRLKSNLEFDASINFNVQIVRCKTSLTQKECKTETQINDFIDHLIVGQVEQEKKIQIDDHSVSPPLIDHIKFKEHQLDYKSIFKN